MELEVARVVWVAEKGDMVAMVVENRRTWRRGGGRAAGPEKEEGLEADLVEEGWMAATAVDADAEA